MTGLDDRAILAQRAQRLAQPVLVAPEAALDLVVFELSREAYALEARCVMAVFGLRELSPLPGAGAGVTGLTTWRGTFLTIVDLRTALGLSEVVLADMSKVLVLGEGRATFGLLVDAVRGLVTVAGAEVHAPRDGVAPHRELLRGVTNEGVVVLDGDAVVRHVEPWLP